MTLASAPGGIRREAAAVDLLAPAALVALAAHLLVARNYGYFRDELYYLAAGRRLAAGYVDFPAMIALLAALLRATLGESLFALHLIPALAGAALVALTGLMARELGGGRAAQGLAALGSLVAVAFLATGSIFSMDVLDQLWWGLAALVMIRLLRTGDTRLWLLFGLIAGLGLLTKLTMLFFGFGLVVGLLLTPRRALLASRWLWLGGALAFAFLLPYLLWNAANGFPTLGFWANYGGKLAGGSLVDYVAQQVLTMNPLSLPLWVAGLWFYLRTKAGLPYRALGWAFVVLFALFALTRAKAYFLSPAYPMLFAAGAVLIEHRAARWVPRAYAVALVASGIALAPVAMPILPPPVWGQVYGPSSSNGLGQTERNATALLPQHLADRFGWDTLAATVARADARLSPADQARACVITGNYGEAAALEFYGPSYHLPPAISGHNTYFLWGPDGCDGQVVLSVGIARSDLDSFFGSVEQLETETCQYCMPYEDNLPIYVARQPKMPIQQAWARAKHFD